ncbi:MAG: hypothetical protein JO235_01435 [Chroococcidiopsidaceae cyanobacterium CP_BM_RX_35]|nr:hypothetical protein [Chroococcidiopsidaceae cyanobacterium CP_BM_RX_35]
MVEAPLITVAGTAGLSPAASKHPTLQAQVIEQTSAMTYEPEPVNH